jgi:histone H1/5
MAIRKRKSSDTNKLVDGCGTILKNNRLKGGYKLVKRKKKLGKTVSTTTAQPKKRRGRPAKATAPVMVSAPAKRRGRPAKATAPVMVSAPAKRRGRPAKATTSVMITAPAKRRGGKKVSATAKAMKPSVKTTAKRIGRRVSAKV